MARLIPSALWCAAFAVVTVGAAQTPSTSLCDGIATRVRGNREIASSTSKENPLSLLAKGNSPYIELPGQYDMRLPNGADSDKAEFVKRFRAKFDPSDALAKALNEFLDTNNNGEVFSLPDSDLHVVESFGGTANCEGFLFFQTAKGRQTQPLPPLPAKGNRDGDNLICSGYHDDGNLARIDGNDVFLEFMSGETDNNYQFRVVPWREGRWANACRLEANFGTEYKVAKVFVPNGGPVTEEALRNVAAQIVEQHAAASDTKKFAFGPPIPEREKEDVLAMSDLASKMHQAIPVPAFGAEKELGTGDETLQDAESYPLVLGGQTYLMSLGHAAIGWRVFSNSILVLFTMKNGKLEPVGSAIVEQSQGTLESLRVTASR